MMRRKKRPAREYVIAGILVVALLWLSTMLVGIFRKEEIARHSANEAREELAILEEREATLSKNVADLQTERGQEASIRETYGVARPGEEVIIVVEREEEEPLTELSWWSRFLGFMGL